MTLNEESSRGEFGVQEIYHISMSPPYLLDVPDSEKDGVHERAISYINKFLKFEEYVSSDGRAGDINVEDIPLEHRKMLEFGEHAFSYYRHSLWSYVERISSLNPWASMVRSLIIRMRKDDPEGFSEFVEVTSSAAGHFLAQKRNAEESEKDIDKSDDFRKSIRSRLRVYVELYEIDYPLWFLGVIAKASKTGSVRAGLFGGPVPKTAQGALVNEVHGLLESSPMGPFFKEAYDAELRNAIQHNDYLIDEDASGLFVSNIEGSKTWSAEKIYQRITGTQQLMQAVMSASVYVNVLKDEKMEGSLRDSGVVHSVAFVSDGGMPTYLMFQMWCFFQIEPTGDWLDERGVSIEELEEGLTLVRFTDNLFSVGVASQYKGIVDSIEDVGWVHIKRVPVAPKFDLGFPVFRSDGIEYEVVGVPDEHMVRLKG